MSRIPDHATRVFSGVLFDVYQWEQTLFDGTTATFEAVRRAPSVQVLATTGDGRMILLREEQPHLGEFIAVPGGRVEPGDGPEETVRKELLEELGMEAAELVPWQERRFGSTIEWVTHDYVARRCRRVQPQTLEPGERIEPYLVSFAEFLEEVERPEFRNRDLRERLFRMRHTPGALEALEALLFPTR